MTFPLPDNEAARAAAVDSYRIAGTPPEADYDDIAELAAQLCGCPVGIVNIVAGDHEWMKAKYGLAADESYMPRGTMCSSVICQSDLVVVPDLAGDPRFADMDMVREAPHFRFYGGMPLTNPEGYSLGTLCVLDFAPRKLSFAQTEALRRLSRQTIVQLELRRKLIELTEAREALEAEKRKSDDLLRNILPARIADALKADGAVEPRHFDCVTVMFADFKGFTRFAETSEPRALVNDLDRYFSAFDEIVGRHGLEKLKTIGDAYMCAGGLPEENRTHAVDACRAALEMQAYVARANRQREKMRQPPWALRIGLHSGPVMAGVVGRRKFTYDIWGNAVNVAARIEAGGEPGRVALSDYTWNLVRDRFEAEHRGTIEAKNKGRLDLYLLTGPRS